MKNIFNFTFPEFVIEIGKITNKQDKDITKLTTKKLQKIENLLNNMPRKMLGYKTPNQLWNEKLKLASNSMV